MKTIALAVSLLSLLATEPACDSNPTPHPAGDAMGSRDESANANDVSPSPPGYGPDEDNDGIADCFEANGAWDGSQCNLPVATPDAMGDTNDASDGSDAEADVTAPGDSSETSDL